MRILRVPAWVAYPVAVGICLTPSGMRALVGTYTVTALLIALAWTYRWHPVVAGVSYATLAASRGVAAVLLVYPLYKRQWRTLLVALGTLLGLLIVALVLEPTVVGDFLTKGRASIEVNVASPDLFTFDALASRRGVPRWAVWGVAAAVVLVGMVKGREVFWLSVWFMLAVTPIVWWSTPVMALPLFVVIWQSGQLGRFISLLVGVVYRRRDSDWVERSLAGRRRHDGRRGSGVPPRLERRGRRGRGDRLERQRVGGANVGPVVGPEGRPVLGSRRHCRSG